MFCPDTDADGFSIKTLFRSKSRVHGRQLRGINRWHFRGSARDSGCFVLPDGLGARDGPRTKPSAQESRLAGRQSYRPAIGMYEAGYAGPV